MSLYRYLDDDFMLTVSTSDHEGKGDSLKMMAMLGVLSS